MSKRNHHEHEQAYAAADDFAFGMSGSLYITTHPEPTPVRLDPSGARATWAGPEQGNVVCSIRKDTCAPGWGVITNQDRPNKLAFFSEILLVLLYDFRS
jgi:hypothetical protein